MPETNAVILDRIESFCRERKITDYDDFMAAAANDAPDLYRWAGVSGKGSITRTKYTKRRIAIVRHEVNKARRIAEGKLPEFTTEEFWPRNPAYDAFIRDNPELFENQPYMSPEDYGIMMHHPMFRVIENATGMVIDDNHGLGYSSRAGIAQVAGRRWKENKERDWSCCL